MKYLGQPNHSNQQSLHLSRKRSRISYRQRPDPIMYVAIILIALGTVLVGNRLIYHNPFLPNKHRPHFANPSVVGLNEASR